MAPSRTLVRSSIVARGRASHWAAYPVTALLLLALGTYHQPFYPAVWLDEGFVLQGAENLLVHGAYALRSSEGLRVLDQPLIANGPGLVLPLYATFALLGPGLLQARVTMAIYGALTGLLYLALGHRLWGWAPGLISLLLFLAVPAEGLLFYGRQAMGNVPALAYFLAGYLLWMGGTSTGRVGSLLGAGLCFGLASITKGQYVVLYPALVLVGIAGHLGWGVVRVRRVLLVTAVAAGVFAAWTLAQLAIVGLDAFGEHLAAVGRSARVTVSAFRVARIPGSLWYLVRSGMVLFVGVPWLQAARACWRDRAAARAEFLIVVLVPVWTVWYVLASVGWPRYAFEPYAIGLLLAGPSMAAAADRVRRWRAPVHDRVERWSGYGAALLLVAALSWGTFGLVQQVAGILAPPDASAQAFARYLSATAGPDAVVESWEWQLEMLADVTFHHPENAWVDRYTALTQFGDALESPYEPAAFAPGYLVHGPFAKWTGIYDEYLAAGCCAWEFTSGAYDLYRVSDGAGR